MFPNFVGKSTTDRVRVRTLGMTQFGKISQDCRAFDTELASQIVNANLASGLILPVNTTKMEGQTICSHGNSTLGAFLQGPGSRQSAPRGNRWNGVDLFPVFPQHLECFGLGEPLSSQDYIAVRATPSK
jgi:hypothetical protein